MKVFDNLAGITGNLAQTGLAIAGFLDEGVSPAGLRRKQSNADIAGYLADVRTELDKPAVQKALLGSQLNKALVKYLSFLKTGAAASVGYGKGATLGKVVFNLNYALSKVSEAIREVSQAGRISRIPKQLLEYAETFWKGIITIQNQLQAATAKA